MLDVDYYFPYLSRKRRPTKRLHRFEPRISRWKACESAERRKQFAHSRSFSRRLWLTWHSIVARSWTSFTHYLLKVSAGDTEIQQRSRMEASSTARTQAIRRGVRYTRSEALMYSFGQQLPQVSATIVLLIGALAASCSATYYRTWQASGTFSRITNLFRSDLAPADGVKLRMIALT